MKRIFRVLLVLGVTLSSLVACAPSLANNSPSEVETIRARNVLSSQLRQGRVSYLDFWGVNSAPPLQEDVEILFDNPVIVAGQTSISFVVPLEQDARAQFQANIRVKERTLINPILSVTVNDVLQFRESSAINVAIIWQDETKDFDVDSFGNQTLPTQISDNSFRWINFFNNTYVSSRPLQYLLTEGENVVTITNVSSDAIEIAGFRAVVPWEIPNYVAPSNTNSGLDFEQRINAISYISKNSSFVRLGAHPSITASPFDPVYRKLNVIDGLSWNRAGQAVDFKVTVPQSGYYKLSFHYNNDRPDFSVFRSIYINGVIPFKEAEAYAFKPTRSGRWAIETLSDAQGNPLWFYLEAGDNVLTLRAETAPIQESLNTLQLLVDHINQFALDIRKITGGEVDRNRTWRLTEFIPETESVLAAYETLIESVIDQTARFAPNGASSSTLSFLQIALFKVRRMSEKPDELPLFMDDLHGQPGSVVEMVGLTLFEMSNQNLTLNELAVSTVDTTMVAEASLWSRFSSGVESFIGTFTSPKFTARRDPEILNVWVNRSIPFVDTMQKLVDSDFTRRTGIRVNLSVMPDPNRLILANAANQAPDVALGLLSYMPFDFAIRGAALPLSDFDDFWEVASNMAPGAFVPYIFDGKAYGMPESLNVHTLVYRRDILDGLGLDVPDTWQDVIDMLPELQRFGMNFYFLTAGGGSLKWFYQTSPFIYQLGGSLYDSSGFRSALDSQEAVAGVRFLTDLFTLYSMPKQVPSFFNAFRQGTLPVGIADFGTYLLLNNAAPELAGQWGIAPYPGKMNEHGEVARWDIVNGTAAMIFNSTDKPNESWEFLKWWMETETQTSYAFNLKSTFGPEFVWLSANLDAVANTPIPFEDRQVILEQARWLNDVPRTPGQYMLERGLSDIWNTVVFDGTPVRIAIDRQKQRIDREIRRRMIEFGFLNPDGTEIRPYVIYDIEWIKQQIANAREASR